MAFRVSPGVTVTETDLTTVVPAIASTEAAFAGVFHWGPVEQPVLVSNEGELSAIFGKPNNNNAESFLTAASFLQYGNALYVTRAANTSGSVDDVANTVLSAVANTSGVTNANHLVATIKNSNDYDSKDGTFSSSIAYIAKYPGSLGNSLRISVCDNSQSYTSNVSIVPNSEFKTSTSNAEFTFNSNVAVVTIEHDVTGSNTGTETVANNIVNSLQIGDIIAVGNSSIGRQNLKLTGVGAVTSANDTTHTVSLNFESPYALAETFFTQTISRSWEFSNIVERAPATSGYVQLQGNTAAVDEIHVVVVDEDGAITGSPSQVLEVFDNLSRANDAKNESGQSIYYKDVINQSSSFVWFANDRAGASSANALNITTSSSPLPLNINFIGGSDGLPESQIPLADLAKAYDKYEDSNAIDVSFLIQGKARLGANDTALANYLINICQKRKDCMAFISPAYDDVVNQNGDEVENIIAFRDSLTNSSYAVLDTGYKYMYDKYADKFRWVPLNGDIAGLVTRTTATNDAWWSPAGFNRGQIANVVDLAFSPTEVQRDSLYKKDVNSIVAFRGEGTVLFGDKTLLGKPSAFDRINVRRLFIVLEKAIATASRSLLFEFNDSFTRANFRNFVEPYLRTVQDRRGIQEFKVVCDETNNTSDVIDRNEFVGDIYIKPSRSINFIRLNFVAVGTGVNFSEVVG